ncbi:MAG: hypothetical protein LAT65_00650 [Saccharospirillum sp.]|nr:hypothetical protein [Saccharospirillum sp.]
MNKNDSKSIRPAFLFSFLVFAMFVLTACDSNSNNNSSSGGQATDQDTNPRMLTAMKTAPAVDAQTPNALRTEINVSAQSMMLRTFSARDGGTSGFNAFDYCNETYGAEAPIDDQSDYLFNACLMSYQMKETFFSGFFTDIRASLTRIDEAINPYLDPTRYYACADPNSDVYVEAVMTPTLSFENGDDISGMGIPGSISVNCLMALNSENGIASEWVAMGLDDDGSIRVVEGNDEGLNTYFITLTAAGDIDAWFTVGRAVAGFNTDGSQPDYDEENDFEAYTTGSTGLYRVYSDAASGLIQMSVTGSQGMGDGACGMRVMTDGVYLYFNGNINSSRGICYDGDYQSAGNFDEDLVEFEVCIRVDGDDFDFKEDLTECENRGIAPVAIDGSSGNVTVDELFNIELFTREQFKPYNVTKLFTQVPTVIGTDAPLTDTGFVEVLPPEPDSASLEGYVRGDLFFRVDSSPNQAASGFCADANDATENPSIPVAAKVVLSGSVFSQEELDNFNNSPVRQIVTEITSGYRDANVIEYWANYDVDVVAKVVGGSELMSWSDQTTPIDRMGNRLVHELLPGFSLGADDVIEITLDGHTQYDCDPQTGNRVAIARPNLGRSSLRYFMSAE